MNNGKTTRALFWVLAPKRRQRAATLFGRATPRITGFPTGDIIVGMEVLDIRMKGDSLGPIPVLCQ